MTDLDFSSLYPGMINPDRPFRVRRDFQTRNMEYPFTRSIEGFRRLDGIRIFDTIMCLEPVVTI